MNVLLKYLKLGYNIEFSYNARIHTVDITFWCTASGKLFSMKETVTEELLLNPGSEIIVLDHIHKKLQLYIEETLKTKNP